MSYRCERCQEVVRRNQPRLTHIIEREVPKPGHNPKGELRREVAREIAVCPRCKRELEGGE